MNKRVQAQNTHIAVQRLKPGTELGCPQPCETTHTEMLHEALPMRYMKGRRFVHSQASCSEGLARAQMAAGRVDTRHAEVAAAAAQLAEPTARQAAASTQTLQSAPQQK